MKIGDKVVKVINLMYRGGEVCEISDRTYEVDFGYFGIHKFNNKIPLEKISEYNKSVNKEEIERSDKNRNILLLLLGGIILITATLIICVG